MKKIILTLKCIVLCASVYAQENLFTWNGNDIFANSSYTPLLSTESTPSEWIPRHLFHTYTIQNPNNSEEYVLQTYQFEEEMSGESAVPPYERFVIKYKGSVLLDYVCRDLMHTVAQQTMGQNKSYYQVIPLDDDAFALMLGGWFFGYAEAPEMMVIVIKGNRAKIVFDNHAYAYKYQAPPAFSMEFVDDVDWYEDECVKEGGSWIPNAAALSARTKHKIWREGNVLKYKSWK